VWILLSRKNYARPTALVFKDGELIYEIDLSRVTATYEIDTGGNVVEVRPGEIGVIRADCPDKVCVHTGFVHGATPIICVPNKLEIRVADGGYDALTY